MTASAFYSFTQNWDGYATLFVLCLTNMVLVPVFAIVTIKHKYKELAWVLGWMLLSTILWTIFEAYGVAIKWEKDSFLVITQIIQTDCDTIVHSQICYYYLKMILDLNFLFNKNIYADDEECFKTLEARKQRLFYVNCVVIALILGLIYPVFIPYQNGPDGGDRSLQTSLTINVSLQVAFFLAWMITLLFVHRKINEQGSINANKKMFVIHSALAAAYLFTWVVLLILVLYTEHVASCNEESINENNCFYNLTGIHDIISFINSTTDLLIYCFIVFVLYPRYTSHHPSDDISELTNEQVTQGSRFLKMLGFKNLDDLQETLVD